MEEKDVSVSESVRWVCQMCICVSRCWIWSSMSASSGETTSEGVQDWSEGVMEM